MMEGRGEEEGGGGGVSISLSHLLMYGLSRLFLNLLSRVRSVSLAL